MTIDQANRLLSVAGWILFLLICIWVMLLGIGFKLDEIREILREIVK